MRPSWAIAGSVQPWEGFPSAAELVARYAERSPRGVEAILWYEVLACYRLAIILEEVDRLDRVVGSVLDLARPNQGSVVPTDVNAVVRRTLQVLKTEPANASRLLFVGLSFFPMK